MKRNVDGPSLRERIAHFTAGASIAGIALSVTAMAIGYAALIGFPLIYGKTGLLPAVLFAVVFILPSGWYFWHLSRCNRAGMEPETYNAVVDRKWRYIVPTAAVALVAGCVSLSGLERLGPLDPPKAFDRIDGKTSRPEPTKPPSSEAVSEEEQPEETPAPETRVSTTTQPSETRTEDTQPPADPEEAQPSNPEPETPEEQPTAVTPSPSNQPSRPSEGNEGQNPGQGDGQGGNAGGETPTTSPAEGAETDGGANGQERPGEDTSEEAAPSRSRAAAGYSTRTEQASTREAAEPEVTDTPEEPEKPAAN
ncbi:hypothetical protein [Corynebacterium pelargi]|uniref:Uncharacterized protein n=1 Tax=Corynebacterium pelargi TaxID=1471400 RepID=A0A410W636_9CORY|nr:hypothetical protein [Corynebacterium pelargi]QAU51410.1 hypothetical protein CPELA_00530 [Corynebacterium pelargi]